MSNGTAQEKKTEEMSLGQFAEFSGAVATCLPRGGFNAQYYIDNRDQLRALLYGAFVPQIKILNSNDFREQIIDWQNFYQEVFGLTVDFSQVPVPNNKNTGLNFLQFMAEGLTYPQIHDKEKEMYSKYWDWNNDWPSLIDQDFEERTTDKNYAIWHSGNVKADEVYKNKKADWILKKRIKTMTRLEGAIFGLYMLWKHNIIIDQKVISLWSGSRYSDGRVPSSFWHSVNDKFHSGWYNSGDAVDNLRPRPVVS